MKTVQLLNGNWLLKENIYTEGLFLSCDWGTTSMRLQLVVIKTGEVVAGISDSDGIKKTYLQWADYSGPKNREEFYLSFLGKKVELLSEKVKQNLDNIPVVLSGMASASIGLKELPYRTLPISLDAPGLHIYTFKQTPQFPHNLYLISGIRTSDDVMRGEETQLLGLSVKHKMQNGVYVLPGTHSKHVYIKNHTITDFKTYVTGEVFELLATQSILSDSISKPENPVVNDAFRNGCEASLKENLLHSLFTVRSRHLLQKMTAIDNYDYLSGLLIGSEMSALARREKEPLIIAGEEPLLSYYLAACKILKLIAIETKLTSDITAVGHRKILNNIQK